MIYFDAVQFSGAIGPKARKLSPAVVRAFCDPFEISASYLVGFQKNATSMEHFSIGDRYDLIPGDGLRATVKITTLVGCVAPDEEIGNDSFIAALATVEQPSYFLSNKSYDVVQRHQEPKVRLRPKTTAEYLKFAHLDDEPVRFDIETQIASLLDQRMKTEATEAEKRLAGGVAPALKVQPFRVADGSLRYYVRANWKSGKEMGRQFPFALAAWIEPAPTLHILAVEKRSTRTTWICSMWLISVPEERELLSKSGTMRALSSTWPSTAMVSAHKACVCCKSSARVIDEAQQGDPRTMKQ